MVFLSLGWWSLLVVDGWCFLQPGSRGQPGQAPGRMLGALGAQSCQQPPPRPDGAPELAVGPGRAGWESLGPVFSLHLL